jgi:pyridoxamine 5'-phosphate oxidase-like protein
VTFAREPGRERPESPPPSYGVPETGGELVAWSHVVERLDAATAYWLATVTPGGRPHVVPIWGVLVDHDLYLEIGAPDTAKARNLVANDEVVVHLDDPDDVVIVRGRAVSAVPDPGLGQHIAAAMHAKYPGYGPGADEWDEGGLVRIDPRTVLAWRDMPTATRWRFDARQSDDPAPREPA